MPKTEPTVRERVIDLLEREFATPGFAWADEPRSAAITRETIDRDDARLKEDLAADSLDVVELALSIEKEFDCRVSDEEGEQMATVGDVVRLCERKARP